MQDLFTAASEARQRAYCPYSHFAVGAALLTEDGEIITGCNAENASYPLGLCAERAAVFRAVSEGHRRFRAIAIAGAPEGEAPVQPCPPCGACLQVLAELCGDAFEIRLADRSYTLRELLPVRFGLTEDAR